MILPNKYLRLSESFFGFAGYLINFLDKPTTLDELWNRYKEAYQKKEFPSYHSFENLVLAIDLLFAMGVINSPKEGKVELCG